MTAHTLMQKLAPYKGKQLIDVIDEIEKIAAAERRSYSVNVMDPAFNVVSINDDFSRLNVRTDQNCTITSFTIG